jgi:malic enzyme
MKAEIQSEIFQSLRTEGKGWAFHAFSQIKELNLVLGHKSEQALQKLVKFYIIDRFGAILQSFYWF